MISLNFFQIVLLVATGQGLFLGYTLISLRREKHPANKYLGIAVLLMTYFISVFLLNDSGYRRYVPLLPVNGYSIAPLIPVMFYFYFRQLNGLTIDRRHRVHFVPFIFQFIYWIPLNFNGIIFSMDPEILTQYYNILVVRFVSGIHMVLFLSYGWYFLKSTKNDPRDDHDRWIWRIKSLYGMMALIFTAGTLTIWLTESNLARYVFFGFLSVFIYTIGYLGFARGSDFLFKRAKYTSSHLTRRRSREIYQSINVMMQKDRLYLNPKLRLEDLAAMLDTSVHHVSRAINENSGRRFSDFVNEFRIEAAKNLLLEDEIPKMFAVALESGFTNKVSFYKNFKKFTGKLPLSYRDQHVPVISN